jgi:sensor histidine kinase YesM
MGYANGYLGNLNVSLQNMREVKNYYETQADSANMAKALSDIAYLLQALSYPEEIVMENNLRSLSIREKISDETGVAYSLNNIGALYWKWGKHETAVEYFKQALPCFIKLQLDEEIATTLGNIGAYFIEISEFDSAYSYLNKALDLYKTLNHRYGEALTLSNLGKIYLFQRNYTKALEYNQKSLIIREDIGDREGLASNYYNIGFIAFEQNNTETAKEFLHNSLTIANTIGMAHMAIQITETLSELYLQEKDFENAYTYLHESKILNDSIFGIEKHRQLEELREKYEAGKKEAENQTLLAENNAQRLILERNKIYTIITASIVFLLILIMFLFLSRKKAKADLKALQNEQRLLRSQMNPHFIFNAISAIQNYILSHSPRDAVNYLSNVSTLMRLVIDNSRNELISIENEEKLLINYFSLQLLRFPTMFTYKIEIDKSIDIESTLIPPMLVQPFVENAIEHGLKNIEYPGEITVRYILKNKKMKIEIEDNGIGIKKPMDNNSSKHSSFAIDATKERLKIINNKKNIYFQIINKNEINMGKGTLVSFIIPCNYKK